MGQGTGIAQAVKCWGRNQVNSVSWKCSSPSTVSGSETSENMKEYRDDKYPPAPNPPIPGFLFLDGGPAINMQVPPNVDGGEANPTSQIPPPIDGGSAFS